MYKSYLSLVCHFNLEKRSNSIDIILCSGRCVFVDVAPDVIDRQLFADEASRNWIR